MNVTVRVTAEQKAEWEAAAARSGARLSAWVKDVCDAHAAQRTATRERPAQRRQRPPARPCPRARHHRPGAYCKTCGAVG